MNLRELSLPAGWYPRSPEEISRFLSGFAGGGSGKAAGGSGKAAVGSGKAAAESSPGGRARGADLAAISPHAGWFFSGRIAARAVSALDPDSQTLAIIGGHLPRGAPPLFALEDAVETPFGPMPVDTELRDALIGELAGRDDSFRDNTVEVLVPMVRFFFPEASLLWVRFPAEESSFEAGRILAQTAAALKRKLAVLGSTDLTHYGDNYGFSPRGKGPDAHRWVREVNDANFIRAVESGSPEAVLERAGRDRSSCSAGAVLGAMGFARALGAGPARLLEYGTSADAPGCGGPFDSFVGYGALAFGPGKNRR
ncbi:MAG: AmmeMemoRadiSam system protein B [Treponema sp.]|jgi:AmmeMemoRadiSam system protein B|nr:AmmeMemoRadiSam system protein B [Treponema sp.]